MLAQSTKPQFLSTSHGRSKAHVLKRALGTLFLVHFEEAQSLPFFSSKKDELLQLNVQS